MMDHIQRSKQSMNAILNLTSLPDITTDPVVLANLEAERSQLMTGETCTFWAIQDGDDLSTRQVLPEWIAGVLEKELCNWNSEKEKWDEKIQAREFEGKTLAPAMQQQYSEWLQIGSQRKFLFSKEKKCRIKTIRSNADLKKMQKDLFSLRVHMSVDCRDLTIQAGNGGKKRLVVLRGPPTEGKDLPGCLDKLDVSELEHLPEKEEEEHQSAEENEDDWGLEEQNALLDEEKECAMELMVDTSDEEQFVAMHSVTGAVKVKSFMHRAAYKELEELGLTAIPSVTGASIGCHAGARQWQAYYPNVHSGLCFSWGGSTKRTEKEALLKTFRGLLESHLSINKKDVLSQMQLKRLIEAEASLK